MKNYLIAAAIGVTMLFPSLASAQALTTDQVNAVIGLLRAFGVDEATVDEVYAELTVPDLTIPDTMG